MRYKYAGTTTEDFGCIAVLSRSNAVDDERAMLRQPMTLQDYMTGLGS